MSADRTHRIAYVLKMYPRFSETFIVSEILAREAAGEEIVIFSLRPPADARFHPELARVQAPVIQVGRSSSPRRLWETWGAAMAEPELARGTAAHLEELVGAGVDDAEQALAVALLAREHGVTHLHAHFASMATTVARLAGLLTDLPYSFTAHAKDIFHHDVQPEDLARKLRDADHAVTISEYNREHLRSRFGTHDTAHLELVRNGLELERFPYRRRGALPAVPVLLGVGRLVEKKGFDQLIDVVRDLREEGREVRAEIVGDGPLRAHLAARITELGLEQQVHLLGPRTQEEVRRLLEEADLFVAPFVIGADGNADGLPTVLLEAMATGIPCVAASVTAVGEVILEGRTGWLVPSGDTPALVEAVREALDPATDRLARTDAARELVVAHYDSRSQARRLRELVARSAHRNILTQPLEAVPADPAAPGPSTTPQLLSPASSPSLAEPAAPIGRSLS
ncbi:colanic acid biosynthesis glycosyltransferase WcaL [Brachybacterium vulturis]|uniref:Colanic acid biosynthesis glycosyltransferase WcaL n=1 Tax=Brachybacterium vulturis TaxID=2017484 RepID=A0A291GIL8_9MICO|nr:glycosyltransferase family 4 protein [Brachybacterium vulturis]ATG50373.1 colanic acid biosynthesis glycosyltransferase WcaL [Brachybacterium vulturis]